MTSISLLDTAAIVKDGLDLLECVDFVDDTAIEKGSLFVATEHGRFTVQVAPADADCKNLASQYGGVSGEHPQFSVWDWLQAVAADGTRLGYWDWVASRLDEHREA